LNGGRVVWLANEPPGNFPPVADALREPNGLLAAGGDLDSTRLLEAYRRGIFPWYEEGQPLLWWSPDPRCVFLPGDFHVSRRLRREIRRRPWELRCNTSFSEVIGACAAPRRYQPGTWITPDMRNAYERLHAERWAHSVEVWLDGDLVGGLYGLAIGRAFFGESMFSRRSDASKLALLLLEHLLARHSLGLLDCQVRSAHLLSLGARLIPRQDFIALLDELCAQPTPFNSWPPTPIPARDLLGD
jgi:leucyl/phenylalanyl-tRNA---protein transferase